MRPALRIAVLLAAATALGAGLAGLGYRSS